MNGKAEREPGAVPELSVGRDRAAVGVCDLAHEREAESEPGAGASVGVLCADEQRSEGTPDVVAVNGHPARVDKT